MSTTTNLDTLVINYLSQIQYDEAVQEGTLNENQLYLTPAQVLTLATVARSGSYNDLSNKPTFATVATSGSYNDLSNKPTIPTIPANNIIGSGTSGNLVKFDGTNSITDGPALGSSTSTYLRNDGSWATPPNTITTATTTGSGNAVTAVTASNGAITVTKGANFLPVAGYSTTDLTAGSSALATGQVYLVYE